MLLSDFMLLQGSREESMLPAQGSDVLGPLSPWRGLCIAELTVRVSETMEEGSNVPMFESNSALRS